jgi:cytochrome c biogenesis protein
MSTEAESTVRTEPSGPGAPPPPRIGITDVAMSGWRRLWRWLTSMRTALILLFLLALAAIPGSLLPQHNLSESKVSAYYRAHPTLAPLLDRVGAFNVFSSAWFSAIYLLLFISLVGCLVPRAKGHLQALLRRPPDAPARLDRMPAYADGLAGSDPPERAGEGLRALLRRARFRVLVRRHGDGSVTVSAEKGYLKETGNLIFHFSLMLLLVGVALGSWYGYHAERVMALGPEQGFCNTLQQYDSYGLGTRVHPADLEPFCVQLDDFTANFRDNGQPEAFRADVSYTIAGGAARQAVIAPNEPLRMDKARLYVTGHGYAAVVRYTDRYGASQVTTAPLLPIDDKLTSSGAISFPDANAPPNGTRDPNDKQQVGFQAVYLPTSDGHSAVSTFPGERNPVLSLVAYRGDLGLDAGIPHSVYSLSLDAINSGRLTMVQDRINLHPGQRATLDDGSTVEFLRTQAWVNVAVRYDPGQPLMLGGAVCLLLGLVTMLFGRRRRVWFRLRPGADGGSEVTAGALARSEYSGFTEEFDTLVTRARETLSGQPPAPRARAGTARDGGADSDLPGRGDDDSQPSAEGTT